MTRDARIATSYDRLVEEPPEPPPLFILLPRVLPGDLSLPLVKNGSASYRSFFGNQGPASRGDAPKEMGGG